jgi:hypothetical protein
LETVVQHDDPFFLFSLEWTQIRQLVVEEFANLEYRRIHRVRQVNIFLHTYSTTIISYVCKYKKNVHTNSTTTSYGIRIEGEL